MRCWGPKMPNWPQQVPPQTWSAFQALIAAMRDAPTCAEGHCRFARLVDAYRRRCPAACRCGADDVEARLHHLTVPPRPGQSGHPSNLAERAFKEEHCRPQGIPHLWAETSWVKLVFAVLICVSEQWGQKPYSAFEQLQSRALCQALG
jgi:transposase-like protein